MDDRYTVSIAYIANVHKDWTNFEEDALEVWEVWGRECDYISVIGQAMLTWVWWIL